MRFNVKSIKGGVILIGSLFWENEKNAIQRPESMLLARKRRIWRKKNLLIRKRVKHRLPIQYGRSSSSRDDTYTMVFSNSTMKCQGQGIVIPYRHIFNFQNFSEFKKQALMLADVEGITQNETNELLVRSWGCIGIYVNQHSKYHSKVKKFWETLKLLDNGYVKRKSSGYSFRNENSLLNEDFTLNKEVVIDTNLDFLFFTYIKPKHLTNNLHQYPTPQEIAAIINQSGYKTYFTENVKSQILTYNDKAILGLIV